MILASVMMLCHRPVTFGSVLIGGLSSGNSGIGSFCLSSPVECEVGFVFFYSGWGLKAQPGGVGPGRHCHLCGGSGKSQRARQYLLYLHRIWVVGGSSKKNKWSKPMVGSGVGSGSTSGFSRILCAGSKTSIGTFQQILSSLSNSPDSLHLHSSRLWKSHEASHQSWAGDITGQKREFCWFSLIKGVFYFFYLE